jgi:hypothetical protein
MSPGGQVPISAGRQAMPIAPTFSGSATKHTPVASVLGSSSSKKKTPRSDSAKSRTPDSVQRRVRCNCKKSECLKLYCECYSAEKYCEGCSCSSCKNIAEFVSRLSRFMFCQVLRRYQLHPNPFLLLLGRYSQESDGRDQSQEPARL